MQHRVHVILLDFFWYPHNKTLCAVSYVHTARYCVLQLKDKEITMNRILLILVVLLAATATLSAQERNVKEIWTQNIQKRIKHILEEKYYSHQEPRPVSLNKSTDAVTQVGTEVAVSKFANPESEIYAAINPTDANNLVIAPIQEVVPGGSTGGGQLALPIYVSKDFGVTWVESEFKPGGGGGGDPVLAFDADGKLYFSWLELDMSAGFSIAMKFSSSLDGGVTWSTVDTIDAGTLDMNGGKLVDKQWMATDMSNSPRRNTLYTVYVMMEQGQEVYSGIALKMKLPASESFEDDIIRVTDESFDQVQFPSVNVDASGNVHVFWWGERMGVNGLWHKVSNDGQNFGEVHKVAPVVFPARQGGGTTIPEHLPQRLAAMPQFEVDRFAESPYKNALYAVWNSNELSETQGSYDKPFHVYFTASYDGGVSWSAPQRIDDSMLEDANQFHPSISVSPSSSVIVTWYDGREDLLDKSMQYYTAFSHDGGHTFTRNVQVSGAGSDMSVQGRFGIGDYDKAISSHDFAIPIWADGRTNDGDMNIYAAFISLDAVTAIERVSPVISDFKLHNAAPNPAQLRTTISFDLNTSSSIKLTLHDASGKLVRTISSGEHQAGTHAMLIETSSLANGMYFYRLETSSGFAIQRLNVTR
jgi:Secretion system C-terminal sorting domain